MREVTNGNSVDYGSLTNTNANALFRINYEHFGDNKYLTYGITIVGLLLRENKHNFLPVNIIQQNNFPLLRAGTKFT